MGSFLFSATIVFSIDRILKNVSVCGGSTCRRTSDEMLKARAMVLCLLVPPTIHYQEITQVTTQVELSKGLVF